MREIHSLPTIPDFSPRPSTPQLELSHSDSEQSDSDWSRPNTPPTLHSLAVETNALYREVISFSSCPRVVDLSIVNKRHAEKRSKEWLSRKLTPSHQLLERKIEAEELSRRVRGLVEKASALG